MKDNLKLSAPPDATGALFFLPGQYLFKRIENGRETVKALSSEQISRAFREFQTDTGWIQRLILRYKEEPGAIIFSRSSLRACARFGLKRKTAM